MEELIRTIIEVDKKARKMTDKSRKQLEDSKAAIDKRVKELEKQYEVSVEEIIELTTEDENENIATQKRLIDEKYSLAEKKINKAYEEHKDEWVKEIVKRTLE